MTTDLVITDALVVDGTGLPAYAADIEVTDGCITAIGRASGRARRTIRADGRVVTPGFIDLHTHYDAQLHFEATASPASWHGVTTVVTGNCGFTIAPAKPEDMPFLLAMLSRVEGMVPESLEAGVTFRGGDFGQFLANFDGRVGVNVAGLVGHSEVRRVVMGDDASTRPATPEEIAAMAGVVRVALDQGAIGFSSSQLDMHADHLGRPVPSNLASREELVALCTVLAEHRSGILQFFCRSIRQGYSAEDQDLMLAMSRASGNKVMTLNNLQHIEAAPDVWRRNIDFAERAWATGRRMHPFFVSNPVDAYFSLDTTFLFDEVPTLRTALTAPEPERGRLLSTADVRADIRAEFAGRNGPLAIPWDWDQVLVRDTSSAERAGLVGRSVEAIARERGAHAIDALLDVALADGLTTLFSRETRSGPVDWAVTKELMLRPYTLVGSSDGGAHLLTFCGADYTTRFLTKVTPDVFTFEQAVSRLTMVPATLLGLWNRGVIREGAAADLLVIDRGSLAVGTQRFVRDFPGGGQRLVVDAAGYDHVMVNGGVLLEHGEATGATPGVVIRRPGSRLRAEEGTP